MQTEFPEPLASNTLSDEEKALRKNFVGASDCAAILGVSPYGVSATDVWHQKVSGVEIDQNKLMVLGQVYEPLIIRWMEQKLGKKIHKGRRRVHPNGCMQSTPDGYIKDENILIEAKFVSRHTVRAKPDLWGESFSDHIPESYLVQIQHSLEVLTESSGEEWNTAYIGACLDVDDFRIYKVKRNPEVGKHIAEKCKLFIEHYVAGKIEPPQPANRGTYAKIKRGNNTVTVDDKWYTMYTEAKEMERVAKKKAAEASTGAIKQAGPDAEVFVTNLGKFTYKSVESARIDTTKLKIEHPIIAQKVTVIKNSRTFRQLK